MNNLYSFGIDINPISVLVAKVENEHYDQEDIEEIDVQKMLLKCLEESSLIMNTNFELAGKVFNREILQSLLQLRNFINSILVEKRNSLYKPDKIIWFVIYLLLRPSQSHVNSKNDQERSQDQPLGKHLMLIDREEDNEKKRDVAERCLEAHQYFIIERNSGTLIHIISFNQQPSIFVVKFSDFRNTHTFVKHVQICLVFILNFSRHSSLINWVCQNFHLLLVSHI